jgi:putative FmdB family regulatory protein
MPIFDYECTGCGLNFERKGAYSDETPFCGACGCQSRQLVSAPALVFKGSGWTPKGDISDKNRRS